MSQNQARALWGRRHGRTLLQESPALHSIRTECVLELNYTSIYQKDTPYYLSTISLSKNVTDYNLGLTLNGSSVNISNGASLPFKIVRESGLSLPSNQNKNKSEPVFVYKNGTDGLTSFSFIEFIESPHPPQPASDVAINQL